MSLQSELKAAGGVMRTSELIMRGYSAHTLKAACARGAVVRPARGWIALPSLDPELVHAVRHGVVLSCTSIARRLGLWVRRDRGWHFATRTPHAHTSGRPHTVH